MNRDLPIFTYIRQDEREEEIRLFLENCFGEYDTDTGDERENTRAVITARGFIRKIAATLPFDFTIVTESYHIDKSFRDTYYMYFASQHFQVERYCKRLTFLKGNYSWDDLLYEDEKCVEKIESDLIGTIVAVPVSGGIIGRSLLDPKYFLGEEGVYLRKSRFTFHMYGISLAIDAFPYQMQDKETMRCSEVTLLNLMDYYSNTYKDYKTVVPSEIIKSEQRHSHERALPSRGITYHMLTKVMSDMGFSPRLYNVGAMQNDEMSSGITQSDELKRLLHYYVESGIPVAVNVEPVSRRGIGHSLLCIGHSERKSGTEVFDRKQIVGDPLETDFNKDEPYTITDSADFFNRYVVIDDNQFPYMVADFEELSIYPEMQVTNIAVPLYKRMFMEAADARGITYEILQNDKWSVFAGSKDYLSENGIKNVVIRLFLASSRSFKGERVRTFAGKDRGLQMVYELIRMPQFVWVCELYSVEGYSREEPEAFAEIILDGTSANKKGIRNIIMLNYPNGIYSRNPEEQENSYEVMFSRFKLKTGIDRSIPAYRKNLTYYGL